MAHCSITPQEYIKSAFSPQVAILCSEDADNICLNNNLRFVELLQPFSKTSSEARVSDPSGNSVTIKNFKVCFEDMNRRPPQPTLGKRILSDAVAKVPNDEEVSKQIGSAGRGIDIVIDLQLATPWFEVWRDLFLQIQYPSDHEFTKHYIACIIVVSAGSENTMEQINRLSQYQHQQQHQNPGHFPKWFSPNILKYYVLLHDVDQVPKERASQVFDQMTSAYGPLNCHMLQINSRPLNQSHAHMPDPWLDHLKHRRFVDGIGLVVSGNSGASSGSVTPKEDVVGFPSRVSEGDSSESSDIVSMHPLSPAFLSPDEAEKECQAENPPMDVPVLHNRQFLPPDGLTSQHGLCLTSSDIDRIKIFVDEFCLRTLIPHVERQIRYLNDVVTNRSRSKSLLSATRRWLGGNKPPTNAVNSVVYSQEATELQTRRLGDLCFMFGLYEMAYNAYYTAKNDFKSDQAWLYFAGAQEMAALSSFMQGSLDYPKRYLEGSIQTYLNVCKVYNFAIRLTLLSSEVYKHFGEYGEAAMMFIKMTSEESDLLSALMLEQAAHCFINSKRPLPRKYAFHMTLAGHRFCKAGQRSHSYRAYKQAFQVYFNRGWILAEDHIHYSMGKQSFHLRQTCDSLQATARLIEQATKRRTSSHQSAIQQTAYVREYLNVLEKYLKENNKIDELPVLPIPILNSQQTKIILGTPQDISEDKEWCAASHVSFSDDEAKEKRWFALEKELLTVAQGQSMIFRPNLHSLSNDTPNTVPPFVPRNELICIRVVLTNPMSISLTLSDVQLLYTFFNDNNEELCDPSCVIIETVPGFNMPPECDELVELRVWPQQVGRLLITGISYSLSLTSDLVSGDSSTTASLVGKLEFVLKGPRLNNTMAEKMSATYAKDERLNIRVVPAMPRLSVSLKDPPSILSCGELRKVDICLKNSGTTSLSSLYIAASSPQHVFFSTGEEEVPAMCDVSVSRIKDTYDFRLKNRVEKINLPSALSPGEAINGYLWIHAPLLPGSFEIELLFYYEPFNYSIKNSYRLIRQASSVYLYPSIRLKATSLNSVSLSPETVERTQHLHSSNIVFHVKNKCEIDCADNNVEIVGVSANSSSWKIIPHFIKELEGISVNQSSQLCVKCVHLPEENDDLIFSYIPFTSNQALLPCWWKFTLRERLKFKDLNAEPLPPNPAANYISPAPNGKQQDALDMEKASDLDMVVTIVWKARRGEEIILGQHSLHLKRLCDSGNAPPALESGLLEEEKPPVRIIQEHENVARKLSSTIAPEAIPNLVKVSLQYQKEVIHDFNKDPLCRINFFLNLYNTCGSELTSVLDFSAKSTKSELKLFSPQASTNLLNVSASLCKVNLPPWEVTQIQSQCIVTCPGSYCLGSFTLKVQGQRSSKEAWIEQVCDFQNIVIVRADGNVTAMQRHLSTELASIQALSLHHQS